MSDTIHWDKHSENASQAFSSQRNQSHFFDVALVCDDMQSVKAHRIVLSASSDYFKTILTGIDETFHPLICLNGVNSTDLNSILDYIYFGSVQISQENLDTFLDVAQRLKLQGLLPENKSLNIEQKQKKKLLELKRQ